MPKEPPAMPDNDEIMPFIRKGFAASPNTVKLLTKADVRLIRHTAFLVATFMNLVAYLLAGHWGIVIMSSLIMLIAIGNILKWQKQNTRTSEPPTGGNHGNLDRRV